MIPMNLAKKIELRRYRNKEFSQAPHCGRQGQMK